jgi:hypothetical protein
MVCEDRFIQPKQKLKHIGGSGYHYETIYSTKKINKFTLTNRSFAQASKDRNFWQPKI